MKIFKSGLLCIAVMAMITSCQPTKTAATEEAEQAVQEAMQEVEEIMEEETAIDENYQALINKTWVLTGITFYEKDQIILRPEKEKGLTVKFLPDGKLSYKLSVNSCFGTYSTKAETMRLELGGCTKMCCDSEFADNFQSTLSTAKAYEIHDEKYLQIKGEDKILKFELGK